MPGEAGSTERTRLVVLFGGQSAEHDVSCMTAFHVMRACDPQRYELVPVGIDRDGGWHLAHHAVAALEGSGADARSLPATVEATGEAVTPAHALSGASTDVAPLPSTTVVLPLLHGPMGEDGTVQGLLELAGVPYVGSGVLGSALGMDKAMAKDVLARHGVPQARWVALHEHDASPASLEAAAATLGMPVFVKPANMGSSVGVSKARTVDELDSAVKDAFAYDEWVVIEEAITGREIEVAVLGDLRPRASVPGEIVPGNEFYDYEDKYVDDGAELLVPAPLSPDEAAKVQALALEVFALLRCDGLARVDFFYEEGGRGFLCNEVNTMPGFTPISMYPKLWQASGMSYPALIDELVRLALERHARKRRTTSR